MLPFESTIVAFETATRMVAHFQASLAPVVRSTIDAVDRLSDWDVAQLLAEGYPIGMARRYAGPWTWPRVEAELRARANAEGQTEASVWRDAVAQALLLLARRHPTRWEPASAVAVGEALDGILPGWRTLKAEAEQRHRFHVLAPASLDADGSPEPAGDDEVMAIIEQVAWEALVSRRSPLEQQLIFLADQGFTQTEAAGILGLPLGTVKSMVRRVRQQHLPTFPQLT